MTVERRYISAEDTQAQDVNGARMVQGLAARFNSETRLWNDFYEQVSPGAFSDSIASGDDVRALFNHDPNLILARTKSGTLKIWQDEDGLRYEFSAPETTAGKDLLVSLDRGDVSQSSFAFEVIDEAFEKRDDGSVLRKINKAKLFDVSPVTYPAYIDTEAEAKAAFRNAPQWAKSEKSEGDKQKKQEKDNAESLTRRPAPDRDQMRRKLNLVELESKNKGVCK